MAIESDGDLQSALSSFLEVAENGFPVQFRTLHVRECIQVMLQRDDQVVPLDPQPQPRKRPANDTSPSVSPLAKQAKQVSPLFA